MPEHPDLSESYVRLVHDELAGVPTVDIAAVVSAQYVFDFAILYESLLDSWALFPFRLHAYPLDDETRTRITAAALPDVEVHSRVATDRDSWGERASQKIALIERSGLERCIVSDVDNVFVQETPELYLLLDGFDLVFVGSPWRETPIKTNVWGFASNERSRTFAREWARHSAQSDFSDASGLPPALLERNPDLRVKVLSRGGAHELRPAPYDFQVNDRSIAPRHDRLGFRHGQVGRAKILHWGTMKGRGNTSVEARIDILVSQYSHCAEFLPHYVTLANRAAAKLGIPTLPQPAQELRRKLDEAEIITHRAEIPALLNRRGLLGRAAEVGVQTGQFSEKLLSRWQGAELISIDPWSAAPEGDYIDVADRSQEEHDSFFEHTKQRLARFGDRSTIWRLTSIEAAGRLPASSLDFVYLDARHDYESVRQDLEAWFGKVRPGGIIAGHDYTDGELPQGIFGVKSAVDEFFADRHLEVKTTHADAPWLSWYVVIPG